MQIELFRQPAWLAFAWQELGQREFAGPASNPRITDYIRRSGHPGPASDDIPWCAAYVGACLDRAGIAGTGSLMARSYASWGIPAAGDRLGAIAVLERGSDPALGHVGFLVGATADGVYVLGGNQSDAVTVARFDRARVVALRLPATAISAPTSAPAEASDAPDGFAWSLQRILDFEGGWTDDPFDPGGPTNKGITLAVYAAVRGGSVTAESVARLEAELAVIPDALVERIYRERYWLPARCPALPAPLAHFHFDAAVNQGVGRAARMLQEALGVAVDGEIGPLTLAASAARPPSETLARYADIRRRRYRALPHFWRFGRGWLARVEKALAQAEARIADPSAARAPDAPAASPPDLSPPPAEPGASTMSTTDTRVPAPSGAKWWGQSLTIWGALLTTATTVAPAVFAAFGLDVSPDVAAHLGRDVVAVVQAVGGLIGTLMTILGRVRASAPLERRPVALRL